MTDDSITEIHPDDAALHAFANWNRAGSTATHHEGFGHEMNDSILDHIAVCSRCREQVEMIQLLQSYQSDVLIEDKFDEVQRQKIMDYIVGRLEGADLSRTKSFIETDPEAGLFALRYQNMLLSAGRPVDLSTRIASHEDGRQQARISAGNSQTVEAPDGIMEKMLSLFDYRVPMIPVAALSLAVIGAVIISNLPADAERYQIVAYQDNPVISFTHENKLPGIGFFSASTKTTRPYRNVHIEHVEDDAVMIKWHEIDSVNSYNLRLTTFEKGKPVLVEEINTDGTSARFDLRKRSGMLAENIEGTYSKLSAPRRYEWELYGKTDDESAFYTGGGFIISHTDHGVKQEAEGVDRL
jgi:hypothetical protein